MMNRWKLIGAATLLTGIFTAGAGQALAGGFTTFSIGTTFGGGGGYHHRHHDDDEYDDDDDYERGYSGYDHGYGRGYWGHGPRSHVSVGFSTIYTGNPYYSGYDDSPYSDYPYAAPQRPVYRAPPAYYVQPSYNGYNGGYQQSSYAPPPPPVDSCLQEREYQTRINIDGRSVPAYGTACLQPDGTWRRGPAQLAQ